MKRFFLNFALLIIMFQGYASATLTISTATTDLIFSTQTGERLNQLYFGKHLSNPGDLNDSALPKHGAYIPFGGSDLFESAIRTVHADGNPSLDLRLVSFSTNKISDNISETILKLADNRYPFYVNIHFRAYRTEDVIEEWTEISHKESKPLVLSLFASSMLHFDASKYWLTQFHGDWAEEMRMEESPLTSGIKIIDSKLGTRADLYQTPFFMLSLNRPSTETTGEVLAGSLAWTGNFRFLFELDNKNSLRIISGINPYASEYKLQPGAIFRTPAFVFTLSFTGKETASNHLQQWARNYSLLDGNKSRMTLLNNWETTFFKFNEAKLNGLISDAKTLGVDLFLLDDGWFGNKYPRNSDKSSLGDWQPDSIKLPNGINPLIKEAQRQGIKFGIWIEPEMVNPKSELYQSHPDWIIRLPNRDENYLRNQLVLDLPNPKVQNFVFGVLDNLMTRNPGIAYIKWDCNRPMTNTWSPYLKDNQSAVYIDYVEGLYNVFEQMRRKYPHLPAMLCSGGGGRTDYKALSYFTEFWPSDNTDPYERVFIQWGYSYFMPAMATCNHVTGWGNQSIKFKTDVAMMGKMGYDIQVAHLSPEDLLFSQQALKNYSRISDLVWYGHLSRLVSPYSENRAVLMYTSADKSRAVLFSYTLQCRFGEDFQAVKLRGLDADKRYKIQEINLMPGKTSRFSFNGKVFSGDFLMNAGLTVSTVQPQTSAVFELTAE